jgi:ubiquinone/menaquinone biosynthesis C-methylase UbiE
VRTEPMARASRPEPPAGARPDALAYHLQELAIATTPGDRRRILPTFAPRHRRILDVGGGAGQTLVSGVPRAALAVCLERDPTAVELGRRVAPGVRFVRASGEELPFPDGAFDLVVARLSWPYMHIPRAAREAARVLAPGGELWAVLHPAEMITGELRTALARVRLKTAISRLMVLANGVVQHVTGRPASLVPGESSHETFQTVRGMDRLLRAAGFEAITFERGPFFVVTARVPGGGAQGTAGGLSPATTLSVSIDRPADDVARFVRNPANLPLWAKSFCRSVTRLGDGWIVGTPDGDMRIRFGPENPWGVLDHWVSPAPGREFHSPMRAVPNGSGTEVLFTLFQPEGMTDVQYNEDLALVAKDLRALKQVLERTSAI